MISFILMAIATIPIGLVIYWGIGKIGEWADE